MHRTTSVSGRDTIHEVVLNYAGTRILNADHRTAGFMSFGVLAPLHYADQQTCLFQASKELMDFDGYGSLLVASSSQKSGELPL